jgi:hypothetical protein
MSDEDIKNESAVEEQEQEQEYTEEEANEIYKTIEEKNSLQGDKVIKELESYLAPRNIESVVTEDKLSSLLEGDEKSTKQLFKELSEAITHNALVQARIEMAAMLDSALPVAVALKDVFDMHPAFTKKEVADKIKMMAFEMKRSHPDWSELRIARELKKELAPVVDKIKKVEGGKVNVAKNQARSVNTRQNTRVEDKPLDRLTELRTWYVRGGRA